MVDLGFLFGADEDLLFHRTSRNEAIDRHGILLTETMSTIHCLAGERRKNARKGGEGGTDEEEGKSDNKGKGRREKKGGRRKKFTCESMVGFQSES